MPFVDTIFHRILLWILCWNISDYMIHVKGQNNNNNDSPIYDNCSFDDYYTSYLPSSPTTWSQQEIANILRERHRNVLPYTSSAEDVWDALIDLDSSLGSSGSEGDTNMAMIELIYRQIMVPANEYGTPDTWNREHLWPRSRGLEQSGPDNTDVHALRPADWNVNSVRSNLFFGDCRMDNTCTRQPADDEAASDTARSSEMFLPPTRVRGDIARSIFYMERRYSFLDERNTEVLELTDCPDEEGGAANYQMAFLSDLLRWHEEDPIDDDERRRNRRICDRWQGNRNIFVDFPELVQIVYGTPSEKPYVCGVDVNSSNPTEAPENAPTASPDNAQFPSSCSQLEAGDIQVISMSTDNPDAVVLVALQHLPAGLELFMTDNAWTGLDFRVNEGTVKLVLNDDITQGTVFGYGDESLITLGSQWQSTGSASFALSTGGDSILCYCINESNGEIHPLAGLIVNGSWMIDTNRDPSTFSTSESRLPSSLSTIGAVSIDENWDNVEYVGSRVGTKNEILKNLADPAMWNGSNSERLVDTFGNFVITATTSTPDEGEGEGVPMSRLDGDKSDNNNEDNNNNNESSSGSIVEKMFFLSPIGLIIVMNCVIMCSYMTCS